MLGIACGTCACDDSHDLASSLQLKQHLSHTARSHSLKTHICCAQEYVEREDEFDVNPRSPERPAASVEGHDEELDVVECEPVDALYYSTDEDPATAPPRLHHLPLEIEPQRPSTPECAPAPARDKAHAAPCCRCHKPSHSWPESPVAWGCRCLKTLT